MDMKEVESSNIAAWGYDEAAKVLAVKFTGSGKTYMYSDVPAEIAAGMEKAPSVGRYFATMVRDKFPRKT